LAAGDRNGEVYTRRDREILLARLKLHEGDGHRMSVVLRAGAVTGGVE